ncbi:MAG: hypothetical protein IKN33_01195, partial [Selenomonadaceae bacterium]|nr:hypothetical protein [Selenomonadaceae bacterium]
MWQFFYADFVDGVFCINTNYEVLLVLLSDGWYIGKGQTSTIEWKGGVKLKSGQRGGAKRE